MSTLDGKIAAGKEGFDILGDYQDVYDITHNRLKSNAWMCGRVTMEMFAEDVNTPLSSNGNTVDNSDFKATYSIEKFAVSVDTKGLLRWEKNFIPFEEADGEYHIITAVTNQTPKDYLAYLKEKNISYVLAGETDLDLSLLLSKLKDMFNIETLLLEGGGIINGAMLEAGCIDEISLLLCPQVLNYSPAPSLFERKSAELLSVEHFDLVTIDKMDRGSVWMRYKRKYE
jgi:riboflavin biosynthesis pyrimidine reductase